MEEPVSSEDVGVQTKERSTRSPGRHDRGLCLYIRNMSWICARMLQTDTYVHTPRSKQYVCIYDDIAHIFLTCLNVSLKKYFKFAGKLVGRQGKAVASDHAQTLR